MTRHHKYTTSVAWTGNLGSGTMDYRSYERDFVVNSKDKPQLKGSSGTSFMGDKEAYSPEDLLVAAVSACHMLWYLHLCAEKGIVVLEYKDNAYGDMDEAEDGSGHFSKITLRPVVSISQDGNVAEANKLHGAAHKMCFIANSLKCTIDHQPQCTAG